MRRDTRRSNPEIRQAGFALLDLLVSVLILGLFLVPLAMARNNVILLAGEAVTLRQARILATQKVGEIELEHVDEMASSAGDFGEDHPGFTWETEVETLKLGDVVDLEESYLAPEETSSFAPSPAEQEAAVQQDLEIVRVTLTVRHVSSEEVLEPESLLEFDPEAPKTRSADRIVIVKLFLKEPEEDEISDAAPGS